MRIYFARPIAAGTELEANYQEIVDTLEMLGHELTNPFVARPDQWDTALTDKETYERDMEAIKACEIFVWECSVPSNGCGIEVGLAKKFGKPIVALYWYKAEKPLSAMISGDKYIHSIFYSLENLRKQVKEGILDAIVVQSVSVVNIIYAIQEELSRARQKHTTPIHSVAEAYAVILEELDEFWDEVRMQHNKRSPENMRKELIQVAAMCIRTIDDCNLASTTS